MILLPAFGSIRGSSQVIHRFKLPFTAMVIAFHKPYGVLSQFTLQPGEASRWRTLSDFGLLKKVYPLGRLDADSEGLLLFSDEAGWNERLLHPRHQHTRTYWVQVEKIPAPEKLERLSRGVVLEGRVTLPCRAWILDPPPPLPARVPDIRFRKNIPTCWLALELIEGKNRQVRKMTASIGHPTLRLIRVRIGIFPLGDLQPGEWKILNESERQQVFRQGPAASGHWRKR